MQSSTPILTSSTGLQELLGKHSEVFQTELGTLRGFQAQIHVDPEATPRYCKARTVPYSMRGKVEEELDRLVREGTLEPVEHAEWAAPIVAVLKADKTSVQICGDFRMTVNPVSKQQVPHTQSGGPLRQVAWGKGLH